MKAQVVEISGYLPAVLALYMTGRNVNDEKFNNVSSQIFNSITPEGFQREDASPEFKDYMTKLIKYGVAHEHESLLDFIKISILMQGLHRGGQDYSFN